MKTLQKIILLSFAAMLLVILMNMSLYSTHGKNQTHSHLKIPPTITTTTSKYYQLLNSSDTFLKFDRNLCPALHGAVALFQLSSGSDYINRAVWNATQSVRCYARMRGYKLYQLNIDPKLGLQVNSEANKYVELQANMAELKSLERKCSHYAGVLAKRHCISAELLESYDYVIHLDADSGVVNPNHCFEEYITPGIDLHFLIRVHSGEIQAGHYVARKSGFAREFLLDWANQTCYAKGSDQGILHQKLADHFLTSDQNELCAKEKKVHGYFPWIKCIRNYTIALNSNTTTLKPANANKKDPHNKQVKFFARAQAFVRDGWSSEFKWSPQDFMLHAMKSRDDVLFSHGLRAAECTNTSWIIPYRTKHMVTDVEDMKKVWRTRDRTFYKIYPNFALISRLEECWPDCADLII